MTEIVKVQRPIIPPDGNWLIYDKNRVHATEVPAEIIPDYIKTQMGLDFKGYFIGAWSSIVGWGLSERVEDQDW